MSKSYYQLLNNGKLECIPRTPYNGYDFFCFTYCVLFDGNENNCTINVSYSSDNNTLDIFYDFINESDRNIHYYANSNTKKGSNFINISSLINQKRNYLKRRLKNLPNMNENRRINKATPEFIKQKTKEIELGIICIDYFLKSVYEESLIRKIIFGKCGL